MVEVVEVGHIPIEIIILDVVIIIDLGIGDGGILRGGGTTIDHGITRPYMLGEE